MTPPGIIASGRISRNRANEQHFNPSRKLPKTAQRWPLCLFCRAAAASDLTALAS
jgi:hypothetical protein